MYWKKYFSKSYFLLFHKKTGSCFGCILWHLFLKHFPKGFYFLQEACTYLFDRSICHVHSFSGLQYFTLPICQWNLGYNQYYMPNNRTQSLEFNALNCRCSHFSKSICVCMPRYLEFKLTLLGETELHQYNALIMTSSFHYEWFKDITSAAISHFTNFYTI